MRITPRTLLTLVSMVLLCVCLGGCWDYADLEERHLQVGEALDLAEQSEEEGTKSHPLIMVTAQHIVPEAIASQKGGQQQKPYKNLSTTDMSVLKAWHKLFERYTQVPIVSHVKVVVVSEELARKLNLNQLLMDYLRDTQIRYSCLLFIAEGRAKHILEVGEDVPAFELVDMAKNRERIGSILPEMSLQKVSAKMAAKSSFLLQMIGASEGGKKVVGAAVIKGKSNKLIGTLNPGEVTAVNWLTGETRSDMIKGFDDKTGQLVTVETSEIKSRVRAQVQGGRITFLVKVEADGELEEDWLLPGDAFEGDLLQRAGTAVEKSMTKMIRHTLDKLQHQYHADVIGFGKKLQLDHPQVWEKMKDKWDEVFSEAEVKVDVHIQVRDYRTKGRKTK